MKKSDLKLLSVFPILFILLLMLGCSGTVKITSRDRQELMNVSDIHVVAHPAKLRVFGKAQMLPGPDGRIFGKVSAKMRGNIIQKKYPLPDPTKLVQNKFIAQLKSESGFTNFQLIEERLNKDADVLSNSAGLKKVSNGIMLEFTPVEWPLWQHKFAKKWFMGYIGVGKITRLGRNKKVLWRGKCMTRVGNNRHTSYEQLYENDAALLKSWTGEVSSQCAKQLLNLFFGRDRHQSGHIAPALI